MKDMVLVTVECLRYDHAQRLAPEQFGEPHRCVTAGHYTRSALAGLLSGRIGAATGAECQPPTLAAHLRDAGYSTIAVTHSPQTARGLGFHDGFGDVYHDPGSIDGRGSYLREWLGQYRPVREVYRRVKPKHATLQALPSDETAIDQALQAWQGAAPPRFLWIHLMDTHRPYGRGADALPRELSRRAAGAASGRFSASLTEVQADTIRSYYDNALARTRDRLGTLVDRLDDAAVVICGDHGEELGEEGYWFHAPYRRRTVDSLTRVPLWTRDVPVSDGIVRQVDIPTALSRLAGLSPAPEWTDAGLGDADHAVTVAPWAGEVDLRYDCSAEQVQFGGAETAASGTGDTSPKPDREQLQALGYL